MKKCNPPILQCTQCGFCCRNLKRYSVMLFLDDIQNLSEALKISNNEFIEYYCEYDDIVFEDDFIHICYLKTNNTDCPFLEGNLCSVHSKKPIQCKRTPYHFFSYYEIWGYMPCVQKEYYPEGNSYEEDIALMKKIMKDIKLIVD